jgi:phytoene dehydrogenase-like protein
MTRFADLLNTYLNTTPPRLGTGNFRDLATLARLGFDLRRLGRAEMRTFLRLIGINIHDEVTERFENPLLRGALSFDAVLGTHLGPRSPNTIMTYLYRLAAGHGRLAVPTGGMGALAEELAHAARGSGVTIRTNMPVKRIVIENGRVAGVEAAGGERFESLTVVSNADPKRTILELVGTRHVETGFTRRINNIRMRGNAAKLHLALDGLPTIEGVAKNEFGDRLVIAPDEHYVERAFNPAKYGESSAEPVNSHPPANTSCPASCSTRPMRSRAAGPRLQGGHSRRPASRLQGGHSRRPASKRSAGMHRISGHALPRASC